MTNATQFQAFQGEDGQYRWRLLDPEGNVVPVKPGRIKLPPTSRQERDRVARTVDQTLARMAKRGTIELGD